MGFVGAKTPISPKGALFTNPNSPRKRGLYHAAIPSFRRTDEIPPVGDAGIAQLTRLRKLSTLNLDNTKCTDAAIVGLSTLTRLSQLYLDNTAVSDASVRHLSRFTTLSVLAVNGANVTDKGARS